MKNQIENQNDNQIENQIEKNLINQNEKNYCLRLFKEQIDLINQLPEGEREKVLYIAVVNAFQTIEQNNKKSNKNQFDNQIENQNENAYISVSVSVSYYLNQLSNSLHILSKSVLNLLKKTLEVKEFSSNLGGKRPGAGRKKQEQEPVNPHIPENQEPIKKKTDPFTNPLIDKCFEIYKKECPDLLKLGFEPRNREIREDVATFLGEIDADIGYFTQLCQKANSLKQIVNKTIDFKMLIKNHIGIYNGKYKDNSTFDYNEWLKEQKQNESR